MITIKVSEDLKEGKEEIPMKDLEKMCSCNNNENLGKGASMSEVIKADNTILNYLFLLYSDMSKAGIEDMYCAAKNFVHEKTGLTDIELAKATSLTMVELLDYTRTLISMNNEMEEDE